jgi:hypothetical protein
MAITVETDRGRIGPLLAHSSTDCHLVGAPFRILVNAEERKKPAGKSDCASLDSSDSWDKVAASAEKLRNDAGRK